MRTVVLLAMALAGCSWIGVTPATTVRGARAKYCTESYFLPGVDTVFAAGWLTALIAGGVAHVTHNDQSGASTTDVEAPLLLGAAAAAVVYGASAVYGYGAVHECNVTQ